MKRKQNHTYPLEMGEVKVFGIHIKGRNPIDKSIRWNGLLYGRVATDREAADTLGCDGSYCDGHKQCDGASQAKAAIRRTIVKRLVPHVERHGGSRGGKILCKLFAAQKSAKIDAWGMRRSKTKGHLMYCFLAFAREQYVHFFHNSRPCE